MARQCGLCGQSARYLGSHVLSEHVAYGAGRDANLAALNAEHLARQHRWPASSWCGDLVCSLDGQELAIHPDAIVCAGARVVSR